MTGRRLLSGEFPVLPCEMDPERWFAERSTSVGMRLVESAVAACRCCPALDACGEYAGKVRPKFGVWAGRYYGQKLSANDG